ncbi:unnamed protein product [Durusdinium trenchii]|uniref:Uncharacterized protein n=2 Tax=Durusdinium trenchii TaxID=1381693 RepID=A0ABP0QEA9_9DINO
MCKPLDAVSAPKDSASSQRCGLPARCKALLAAFTVLALSSLAIFEIRVNVLLILYMPLVSGQFFEFEWLLPWLDSYLDLEIWWNPENFQAYDLQEIAAEDFTWEHYMKVSQNRRLVTVVRGLMSNTSAAPASFAPESGSKHMQIFSSTRSLPKRSTSTGMTSELSTSRHMSTPFRKESIAMLRAWMN